MKKTNILFSPIRTQKEILEFLLSMPNKGWISAFACGDGSFTSSLYFNKKALWGLWPQCEFNLTQSLNDVVLLNAINEFFNNNGSIFERVGDVGQLSFRKKEVLNTIIIPYFIEYPLIGLKSEAFHNWVKLVNIWNSERMNKSDLSGRDAVIEFANLLQNLNVNRVAHNRKLPRLEFIKSWLNSLESAPTITQKLELKEYLDGNFGNNNTGNYKGLGKNITNSFDEILSYCKPYKYNTSAVCDESRTYSCYGGKIREDLPIQTTGISKLHLEVLVL